MLLAPAELESIVSEIDWAIKRKDDEIQAGLVAAQSKRSVPELVGFVTLELGKPSPREGDEALTFYRFLQGVRAYLSAGSMVRGDQQSLQEIEKLSQQLDARLHQPNNANDQYINHLTKDLTARVAKVREELTRKHTDSKFCINRHTQQDVKELQNFLAKSNLILQALQRLLTMVGERTAETRMIQDSRALLQGQVSKAEAMLDEKGIVRKRQGNLWDRFSLGGGTGAAAVGAAASSAADMKPSGEMVLSSLSYQFIREQFSLFNSQTEQSANRSSTSANKNF